MFKRTVSHINPTSTLGDKLQAFMPEYVAESDRRFNRMAVIGTVANVVAAVGFVALTYVAITVLSE